MNCRTALAPALVSLLCCCAAAAATNAPALKPAETRFTKQQVASRLRQLKELRERGLLTKEFYDRKVEECRPSDGAALAAPAAAQSQSNVNRSAEK